MRVGDYVRTDKGYIFKIYEEKGILKLPTLNKHGEIILHGTRLIDVIGIGDYVNGHLIVCKTLDVITKKVKLSTEHLCDSGFGDKYLLQFDDKEIETVLTKERFKEYAEKVGDSNGKDGHI